MQVEKKLLAEVMIIFTMSAVIYGLVGVKSLPMLLFWNIFAFMAIEDYRYQEVDLRCVILLVLFAGAGAASLKNYVIAMVTGFLIFRLMSLLTTKIYNAQEIFAEKNITRSRHGYLPSLCVGLVIYLLVEKITSPPEILIMLKEILEILMQSKEIMSVLIILMLVLWIFLERRVRKAAKAGKNVAVSMAMGDVLVLGIFVGVFNEKIFAIFFVSLLVQLAEFANENVEWRVKKIEH